jgi:hypothetical protein
MKKVRAGKRAEPAGEKLRPLVLFCKVARAEPAAPFANSKPWRETYVGWMRRAQA